jgi:pimeloyl-ACP methyl ester carboxylesterase
MTETVNGIKVNYIKEGAGENVLILHGWASNIKVFSSTVALLAKTHTVYAFDLPGMGETPEPPEAWDLDGYVDFVSAFIRKMGIEKTVLIGHSFGGRLIIKLAGLSDAKKRGFEITKIILIDSAGIMPKRTLKQKARTVFYKTVKSALGQKNINKMFPSALEKWRKKNGSADYNNATPVMRQTLVKTVNEDLTPLIPGITAPTLLIWGENDTETPLSDGRLMEKLIKGSGLVTLKNAGHFSFLEQEYTYLKVLASFLGN